MGSLIPRVSGRSPRAWLSWAGLCLALLLLLGCGGLASSDGNLLTGRLSRPSFTKFHERLNDGVAAVAGDHWVTDLTAQLTLGDGPEWDLGRPRELRAAYIVADNNDVYALLGSDDGVSWREVWEAPAVHDGGQQPRGTRELNEKARYLRLVAHQGDVVRTVSELAVYAQVPTPWPPPLETKAGHRKQVGPPRVPPIAFGIAAALAAIALLTPWRRRWGLRAPHWLPAGARSPWVWILGGLALLVGVTALHYSAEYRFNTIDDAYISFQYAKNWISGDGLTFNPGERVEGFTNFLWVALLAPLWPLVGRDPQRFTEAAVALTIVLSVVDLALVGAIAHRLFRGRTFAVAVALLLVAFDDAYVSYAMFALENHLVIACMLLGLWLYVARPKRWPWWLGLSFALCGMARPDGLLWPASFALSQVDLLVSQRSRERRGVRWADIGQIAGTFLGPALLYFFARYAYFGYPLPNTFYLKVTDTLVAVDRGVDYLLGYLSERRWIPLLALGALWFVRWHCLRWLVLFLVTHAAYVVYVGGDFYTGHRFLMVLTPVAALLIASQVSGWLARFKRVQPPIWVSAAALAACLVVRWSTLEGGPRVGELQRWTATVDNNVRFMKWLGAVKRPGASLVLGDIGAAGFFADLRVRDVYGIVDTQVAHMEVENFGAGKPGHEKRAKPKDLLATDPRYVKFGYIPHRYVLNDYYLVNDFPAHLRVAGLWVLEQTPPSPSVGASFDMSSHALADWQREGEAFARAPTLRPIRGQVPVTGAVGPYLNSFDAAKGDDATGSITSPPFTLEGDLLRLSVGGGCDLKRLSVTLWVAGRAVRSATGTCYETLGRRDWDIRPWRGQQARLKLEDSAQGPWGHILVDEVLQIRSTSPAVRGL